MAETQEASTGWGGEAWMSSDDTEANLDELVDVLSFSIKNGSIDRVDATTLKAPNRTRQTTPGLRSNGEGSIKLNARRGSDTYIAIKAAAAADDRYWRFNYPEIGVPVWTDDVIGYISDFDEGEISPDGNMEITVSIAINSVVASAAYVAP